MNTAIVTSSHVERNEPLDTVGNKTMTCSPYLLLRLRSRAEVIEEQIKRRALEISSGLHDGKDEPLGSMELDDRERRERHPGVNRYSSDYGRDGDK